VVAILLATYNGERFLQDQLNSIADQTRQDWALYVSDDGSVDATKKILDSFLEANPKHLIEFRDGPKKGFAQNFLSLVCDPNIKGQFFAYCDQDDVWMPTKLERALAWLSNIPEDVPALYCARTEYVDAQLKHIAFSPNYTRPFVFANALVQNIASGNTMVFNHAARKLIQDAGPDVDIPLHDWWTYMLVTAVNGPVHLDPQPTVSYRQHDGNLWGMNAGWKARFIRIKKLFEGRFSGWNARHIRALQNCASNFPEENKKKITAFSDCRTNKSMMGRLKSLRSSGVYRQTWAANLGLLVAVVAKKI